MIRVNNSIGLIVCRCFTKGLLNATGIYKDNGCVGEAGNGFICGFL